ncbi:hypothetical protein ACHAWO_004700 [Cyclotella atomus]|uniref:Uncharacterized protein n=1 Tax=Cyclotella atomus TaxID=382360 RepID=A0ABD3QHY3_9STRA
MTAFTKTAFAAFALFHAAWLPSGALAGRGGLFDAKTSKEPTNRPTPLTDRPTMKPSAMPANKPTNKPTTVPTPRPSKRPTNKPTQSPVAAEKELPPTLSPITRLPTSNPTSNPSSLSPSKHPSSSPTMKPSISPVTSEPTKSPTISPSSQPTMHPVTGAPTTIPTSKPSSPPSLSPTTANPTPSPTRNPSNSPSHSPVTNPPSNSPSAGPSQPPTSTPTQGPSTSPNAAPSNKPTPHPSDPFTLRNALSDKLITIKENRCVEGNYVHLWQDDFGLTGHYNSWALSHDNRIESLDCYGMVLDIDSGSCTNGMQVIIAPKSDSDSQQWTMRKDGIIESAKCPNRGIDIRGYATFNGGILHLWTLHGQWNQIWEQTMLTASPTSAPSTSVSPSTSISPTTSASDPFSFLNAHTNKLITIKGGACKPSNRVELWEDVGGYWQQWVSLDDGSLESVECPGMVLDIDGGSCKNGGSIVLAFRSGGVSQKWIIHDGVVESVLCPNKGIDIQGFGTSNGASLHLWKLHNKWNQLWNIDPKSPTVSPSTSPSRSPSKSPSSSPTFSPSVPPTDNPTKSPSSSPSGSPSTGPSSSQNPSLHPSFTPSISLNPSSQPSGSPSLSKIPSSSPSASPSLSQSPSFAPSLKPSLSINPSSQPSGSPSISTIPSSSPSANPSLSQTPSSSPSLKPSVSTNPSSSPSPSPSLSTQPSSNPSAKPSISTNPSSKPSLAPSISTMPSSGPSQTPSLSTQPSSRPSANPSASSIPSSAPSLSPSFSTMPQSAPSVSPSLRAEPSSSPSANPSKSINPTSKPSSTPSLSTNPSSSPSLFPSLSTQPSSNPSANPSLSTSPSSKPSEMPSLSTTPSSEPSQTPSLSAGPSSRPSATPSSTPSVMPSVMSSDSPSKSPSSSPSNLPSNSSSSSPSMSPSASPSSEPSLSPSSSPSGSPSALHSSTLTSMPSSIPSDIPSESPSGSPTFSPSVSPSSSPSLPPTTSPSASPTSSSPTSRNPVTPSPSSSPSCVCQTEYSEPIRNRHLLDAPVKSHLRVNSLQLKENTEFVSDESSLQSLLFKPPAIIHQTNCDDDMDSIDVVSLGSKTRLDYLQGQIETWASHTSVRNFFGFTEVDDFSDCSSSTIDELESYVDSCKAMPRNDDRIETFFTTYYGLSEGNITRSNNIGWQLIPDYLWIVDDDTFIDSASILTHLQNANSSNIMRAGCLFEGNGNSIPFNLPYGGFGLFIDKAAIEQLSTPIYCDGVENESAVCARLRENLIGEHDIFVDGMTLFELFYKFSATKYFCMHSDWLSGYILEFYLGGAVDDDTSLQGLDNYPACGNMTALPGHVRHCTLDSDTCHNQAPQDMEYFALSSYVKSPRSYRSAPVLTGTNLTVALDTAKEIIAAKKSLHLPNVILMGAPQSDLTDWLLTNGACFPASIDDDSYYYTEESNLFDRVTSVEFYSNHFKHCSQEERSEIIIDASPEYLVNPQRAFDLYRQAGLSSDVKMIVVIREQVLYESSLYNRKVREYRDHPVNGSWFSDVAHSNGTIMSFDEYADHVLQAQLSTSSHEHIQYATHLKSWANLFDRRQILVISYDEIDTYPWRAQWRVSEFLGLSVSHDLKVQDTETGAIPHGTISRAAQFIRPFFVQSNLELWSFLEAIQGPWMEEKPMSKFVEPKFAYVSLLGWTPRASQNKLYLGAIRVLIRSLRKSGAQADIVVLMLYHDPDAEKLLQREGAIVKLISPIEYSHDTSEFEPWFADIALSKLNVFEMTDYSRIQFLDADIVIDPDSSLDSLFYSFPDAELVAEGLGNDSPLRAGWMMIRPSQEVYECMKDVLRSGNFNKAHGWDNLDLPVNYPGRKSTAQGWTFYGSSLEQGLLFHTFYAYPKSQNTSLKDSDLLQLIGDEELHQLGVYHFYGDRKPWSKVRTRLPARLKSAQQDWLATYASLEVTVARGQDEHEYIAPLTEVGSELYSQARVLYGYNGYISPTASPTKCVCTVGSATNNYTEPV